MLQKFLKILYGKNRTEQNKKKTYMKKSKANSKWELFLATQSVVLLQ